MKEVNNKFVMYVTSNLKITKLKRETMHERSALFILIFRTCT